MTAERPQRRGRDFVLGFLASLLLGAGAFLVIVSVDSPDPLYATGIGFLVATVVAFRRQRPYFAIGILCAVVAVPALLVGSCFAIAALGGFNGS